MNLHTDTRKLKTGDVLFLEEKVEQFFNESILQKCSKVYVKQGFIEKHPKFKNVKHIIAVDNFEEFVFDSFEKHYEIPKNIIAITGTNGKTSTAWLSFNLLTNLNKNACYIGTIGVYYSHQGAIDFYGELANTTPYLAETYHILHELKIKHDIEYVCIEASSHGLDQKRFGNIKFDIGMFLNFTQDHLDYHKTMENYLSAKLKIVNYLKPDGKFLISSQIDTLGLKIPKDSILTITSQNQIKDKKIYLLGKEYPFHNPNMLFVYEKENLLHAVLGVSLLTKIDTEIILHSAKTLKAPKGRLERVENTNFIIDFAHTPDAIENVIKSVRASTDKKIVAVFGCGGDRDSSKRPLMFEAALMADIVVVTDDNPRTEKPENIRGDVLKNYQNEYCDKTFEKDNIVKFEVNAKIIFEVLDTRISAIKFVVENFSSDEFIVLICGKGHENYQIIGNQKLPFSDFYSVKKFLKT